MGDNKEDKTESGRGRESESERDKCWLVDVFQGADSKPIEDAVIEAGKCIRKTWPDELLRNGGRITEWADRMANQGAPRVDRIIFLAAALVAVPLFETMVRPRCSKRRLDICLVLFDMKLYAWYTGQPFAAYEHTTKADGPAPPKEFINGTDCANSIMMLGSLRRFPPLVSPAPPPKAPARASGKKRKFEWEWNNVLMPRTALLNGQSWDGTTPLPTPTSIADPSAANYTPPPPNVMMSNRERNRLTHDENLATPVYTTYLSRPHKRAKIAELTQPVAEAFVDQGPGL